MFYTLKPAYSLRGWQKLPRAVVAEGVVSPWFPDEETFDVLRLCNGRCDFSLPFISDRRRRIAEQLFRNGMTERSDCPSSLLPEQEYRLYPARYIRTAHWSITGKCNFNCRHCCMSASEGKLGELPLSTILSMAEELARCGVRSVSLTGGEPLIRGDFWQIVDALLERKIIITAVYSNGWLVNDDFLDRLQARGLSGCEINMSYDGAGMHDWLRGVEGAEKAVLEAFRRCRDRGIPTASEMCIHRGNADTLRETVLLLAELGCGYLKTNPVSDLGSWKENGRGSSIGSRELFQLYTDYIPRYFEDGAPLDLHLGGAFLGYKGDTLHYDIPLNRTGEDPEKVSFCTHARNYLYISPEGRALPCFSLSGMDVQERFPLIPETGLERCLNDSFYMRLLDTKAAEVLRSNPECGDCEYRSACLGGCRAGALETKPDDFLGIDPFSCEFYRGRWMEKIRSAAEEAISRSGGTEGRNKQEPQKEQP